MTSMISVVLLFYQGLGLALLGRKRWWRCRIRRYGFGFMYGGSSRLRNPGDKTRGAKPIGRHVPVQFDSTQLSRTP